MQQDNLDDNQKGRHNAQSGKGSCKEVRESIERMNELLQEFGSYHEYKELLKKTIKKIDQQYLKKQISHEKYTQLTDKILEGKTKEEALRSYNLYLLEVLEQVEYHNSKVFYKFYTDIEYAKIRILKSPKKEEEISHEDKSKTTKKPGKTEAKILMREHGEDPLEIQEIRKAILDVREYEEGITSKLPSSAATETTIITEKKSEKTKTLEIGARTEEESGSEEAVKSEKTKKNFTKENESIFLGEDKKEGFFSSMKKVLAKLRSAEKEEPKKKEEGVSFSKLKLKKGKPLKDPEFGKTLLGLGVSDSELEDEGTRINPYLLAQEAKRMKSILSKEKEAKIYRPSTIGAIANHLTRRISIYLLDTFPDFFRYLYNAIKSANIQILSNTYLNIMVLVTIMTFMASTIFFSYLFFIKGFTVLMILFNTVFASVLVAAGVFGILYWYPFMIIKNRRRNVNANLPFAINHMSAVAGAGVPPSAMFRLIAETEEYEEVSKEIEKIVELIEVFGYDLTTAIKSVSANTPSPALKEFFDGMVSTIESGSDFKQYLRQKADETMLTYSLEREKYLETISTYSDVYTGILIAAPLFFVVALSLVSILGGSVGGIDVNLLIVVGTYGIIPFINIMFLLFLEGTQPET